MIRVRIRNQKFSIIKIAQKVIYQSIESTQMTTFFVRTFDARTKVFIMKNSISDYLSSNDNNFGPVIS